MVQEISFEDISYLEFCQHLFPRRKPICGNLVEGITNISVKLFRIWTSGSGFKDISHLEL